MSPIETLLARHEQGRAIADKTKRCWAYCTCNPNRELHGAELDKIAADRDDFEDAIKTAHRRHLTEILIDALERTLAQAIESTDDHAAARGTYDDTCGTCVRVRTNAQTTARAVIDSLYGTKETT